MVIIKKIDTSDIYNGCLYYLKDQINYIKDSTGSWGGDSINNIVSSKVEHNSYVCDDKGYTNLTLDLNEKYIFPTSYSLMGRRSSTNNYYLKSWELKGRTKEGKWIKIHSQTNNPFSRASIKNFTLSSEKSFNAFKIGMTDKSKCCNWCINIGHIEIFGLISDRPVILSQNNRSMLVLKEVLGSSIIISASSK